LAQARRASAVLKKWEEEEAAAGAQGVTEGARAENSADKAERKSLKKSTALEVNTQAQPNVQRTVEAARFALKYSPPTIILEYRLPETRNRRHLTLRLAKLTASKDPARVARSLAKRIPLLSNATVRATGLLYSPSCPTMSQLKMVRAAAGRVAEATRALRGKATGPPLAGSCSGRFRGAGGATTGARGSRQSG
jgi:hypothetical protein